MVKLKTPIMSFLARGKLGGISFKRSRNTSIAEKTPQVPDAKSPLQIAWRPMFQACVDLWHTLSAAEKMEWESAGTRKHMTGYAWYLSQCLRPNPGIYLPLAGGAMTGMLDMNGQHLHGLKGPVHATDGARKKYVDDKVAAAAYTEGAKAFHDANQNIPQGTLTTLAFNSEAFDTDAIHDPVTNNSRLTCQTAGKYIIIGQATFEGDPVGRRLSYIKLNGITRIASNSQLAVEDQDTRMEIATISALDVGDYVELRVYHTGGGARNILALVAYSPYFMMWRIG